MQDREGRTWERAAQILGQIANAQQGQISPDSTGASSARRWAGSSSASAGSGRKESGSADPAESHPRLLSVAARDGHRHFPPRSTLRAAVVPTWDSPRRGQERDGGGHGPQDVSTR